MNNLEFQKSITDELDAKKNRVRNLIGDKHWGEEGRYKEKILKNLVKKYLPNNLSIGTGFIINNIASKPIVSNQIDIIIYDNNTPPLFIEDDFIITDPSNVKAVIEIKTKLDIRKLKKTIDDFKLLSKFPLYNSNKKIPIFLGIFSYENGINDINNNNLIRNNWF